MSDLFLKIVNMSFSATWLVLAVMVLRLLLKKAPKCVNVFLWGLVALRLVCPFTLESALSLIPSAEVIPPQIMTDPSPQIHTGIEAVNSVVNPVITEAFAPEPSASANPLQIVIPVLAVIWCAGMAVMALYTLISYLSLRRRVRLAVRVKDNIYLSEYVASPFVLGIFRPRIYLPYHMAELDMFHVIAHERAHILRKDHWWKPLGFALLTIHWFNPVLWLAYVLLCRDIELACDERVVQHLLPDQRASYSQALLNCSMDRRSIAACPIAFGEVGVKERVKNVLHYSKPAFWIMDIAVVLCAVVAVCFLTDPAEKETPPLPNQTYAVSEVAYDDPRLSSTWWYDEGVPYCSVSDDGHLYTKDIFSEDTQMHDRGTLEPFDLTKANFDDLFWGESDARSIRRKNVGAWKLLSEEDVLYYLLRQKNGDLYLTYGRYDRESDTASIRWLFKLQAAAPDDLNVTLTIEELSPTGATVLFEQYNTTHGYVLFGGNDYVIQQQVEGAWTDLPTLQNPTFTTEAYTLDSIRRHKIDWEWLYGALPAGDYRIGKTVTLPYDGELRKTDTVYAEFSIEESDDPALLSDNISDMVCIGLVPTDIGYYQYAVIPDQEAAKAAFETAVAAKVSGHAWNGDGEMGITIEYAGEYLYLADSGALVSFDSRIPADAAKPLYDLALETAKEFGWQESVKPSDITDLRSATLMFYGTAVGITDEAKLDRLETMLSKSESLRGGAGCPFGCLLTMETQHGEALTISMAADSCGTWLSNGVYYHFASGNEEFYSLFAAKVIHERARHGYESVQDVLTYLDWGEYDALYGATGTIDLMDLLRDWAMEDPTLERISSVMSRSRGLDGAYAEYYAAILRQLYDTNPWDFSWACLGNATDELEACVLELMAGNFGITPEQTRQLLQSYISE